MSGLSRIAKEMAAPQEVDAGFPGGQLRLYRSEEEAVTSGPARGRRQAHLEPSDLTGNALDPEENNVDGGDGWSDNGDIDSDDNDGIEEVVVGEKAATSTIDPLLKVGALPSSRKNVIPTGTCNPSVETLAERLNNATNLPPPPSKLSPLRTHSSASINSGKKNAFEGIADRLAAGPGPAEIEARPKSAPFETPFLAQFKPPVPPAPPSLGAAESLQSEATCDGSYTLVSLSSLEPLQDWLELEAVDAAGDDGTIPTRSRWIPRRQRARSKVAY